MGLFHVSGRLTGATGRSEAVDFLVDTGAAFLVGPRPLAEGLDLHTQQEALDPVAKRLVPVKGFVGMTSRDAAVYRRLAFGGRRDLRVVPRRVRRPRSSRQNCLFVR